MGLSRKGLRDHPNTCVAYLHIRPRSNHIAGNPHSAVSSQSIDLIFLEPYAVLVVTEVGNFLFLHSF